MKKTSKHPEDMTLAELAAATRQFDRPFAFAKARAMTPPERAEERRLRRARPKAGTRTRKISISLQGDLLQRTDELARKRGMNRSQVIADLVLAGLRRRAG